MATHKVKAAVSGVERRMEFVNPKDIEDDRQAPRYFVNLDTGDEGGYLRVPVPEDVAANVRVNAPASISITLVDS